MRVLVIGSGGREHALVWALQRSPSVEEVWCAPGNGGIECSVEIDISDHEAVSDFCAIEAVDLVVVGPEAPLVAGIVDHLEATGSLAFGPSKEAAQLEGSKAFTKKLCDEVGIPTAAYASFDTAGDALTYVEGQSLPIVIKADGLAAGKGVVIAETMEEAKAAISDCFADKFGDGGALVVIEEFLEGEEASLFALCDGERAVFFGAAQDHKRVGEGDTGPNTGGMGAYTPAPIMSDAMVSRVMDEIVSPTVSAMAERGTPFKGVLFAGLMITEAGPKLIEFNTRFGDPECQALMVQFDGDLGDVLLAGARGDLSAASLSFKPGAAMTVVMATKGYPGAYNKGSQIGALPADTDDLVVFHAGTSKGADGGFEATGGRVLGVTARGDTLQNARDVAYTAVDAIDWPEGFCRRDIGWRALKT
ncbi:MAG: phosphoribosylamine--glycine ligase [Pseudomonadota bacterium]